ncbi:hypothetical protein BHE74_00048834 [Ensete ventricosum]|nr:hypothetical protein BHE74_00048834 [Ensete ventricosum]
MGGPYGQWNLEELASRWSLLLVDRPDFNKHEFPGYCNKRGEGPRCDRPFPLGASCTYKFRRLGDLSETKPPSSSSSSPLAFPLLHLLSEQIGLSAE